MIDNRIDPFDMDAALDAHLYTDVVERLARLVAGRNRHAFYIDLGFINPKAIEAAAARAQATIDDPHREDRESRARAREAKRLAAELLREQSRAAAKARAVARIMATSKPSRPRRRPGYRIGPLPLLPPWRRAPSGG